NAPQKICETNGGSAVITVSHCFNRAVWEAAMTILTTRFRFALAFVLAFATPAIAAASGPMVINGSELKKTYDCKGDAAVVNGGGNVLSFRNCREINIKGRRDKTHT